jgi:hypothetical protein
MTANEQIMRLKIQLGLCQEEYQREHAKFEAAERLLMARESVVAELEILLKETDHLLQKCAALEYAVRELRGYATRFEELNGRLKQRPVSMDRPSL